MIDKPKAGFLGQILINKNLISQTDLDAALIRQKESGGLLGEILVGRGCISDEDLAAALAIQMDLCYIPVDKYNISPAAIKLVPKDIASRYCMIPLETLGKTLTVALRDPFDGEAIKSAEEISGMRVVTFIASKTQIENAIKANYKE